MSGFEVFHFDPFPGAPLFKIGWLFLYDIPILFVLITELLAVTSGWNLQETGEVLGDWKKADMVPVLMLNGKGGPENVETNHSKLIPRNILAQIIKAFASTQKITRS